MKVLIVGSGGRENAIVDALARSAYRPKIYAALGNLNPGIRRKAADHLLTRETDVPAIVRYARDTDVDFAVVGPEAPLAAGLVDALHDAGIPAASPFRDAARLEFDKGWTRAFMARNGVKGVPRFQVFDNYGDACRYLGEFPDSVIKPAGLTGGKGVKVMGEHLMTQGEGRAYIEEVLKKDGVVIEDRLRGEEVTIQAFVDGSHVKPMPTVQDHKRAFDGDVGPNTGGMGSYTDRSGLLPFMLQEDYDEGVAIMQATVEALKKDAGIAYKGTLYGQFMITGDGMKVIEYNARFGDPEAMNVLTLLKTDLVDICQAMIDGSLDGMDIEFEQSATVCKYVVPPGYPDAPRKDSPLEIAEKPEYRVYYASVNERGGKVYTTSSRSLAIVGVADTIAAAEALAEMGLSNVKGEFHCRHDIGKEALIIKRIEHMDAIRGRRHQ